MTADHGGRTIVTSSDTTVLTCSCGAEWSWLESASEGVAEEVWDAHRSFIAGLTEGAVNA